MTSQKEVHRRSAVIGRRLGRPSNPGNDVRLDEIPPREASSHSQSRQYSRLLPSPCRCSVMSQQRLRHLAVVIILVLPMFYVRKRIRQTFYHHAIRRRSRSSKPRAVDITPVLVWSMQTNGRFWTPSVQIEVNSTLDHGGLEIQTLHADQFSRTIRLNDASRLELERAAILTEDPAVRVSYRYWYDEELEDRKLACRRPNWTRLHYSNCQLFHEVDRSRDYDQSLARRSGDEQEYDNYYIGRGFYRDVWVNFKPADDIKTILKMTRFEFDVDFKSLFLVRQEALVMERLSQSSSIVDIYGYCGTSVLVEAIPFEVEDYVIPGTGYKKQAELRDEGQVKPQNEYTPTEKLQMALEMAESIAVLHGYADGVIVHDDIQLRQWLRTREGRLKLGDFNRANMLSWDAKKGEYCKYSNGAAFGNVSV
jgi:serine/threonine protein kinase